ncbi:DMT family transporter, partial [Enterococcus raffinosus]
FKTIFSHKNTDLQELDFGLTFGGRLSTMMSIFSGTMMLAIFLPKTINEVPALTLNSILLILIMGIFSSAVAYVSWTKAFEVAENAASVSNYTYITPLLTTVLGLAIAKESLNLSKVFGGLIILSGLLLFNSGQLFSKKVEIRRLKMEELEEAARVIRESFATVADEFGLTCDNCPTNGAFTEAKHLRSDLENGNQLFGVFFGRKMIVFFELVYKENQQATLDKVGIIPVERENKYGEFILNNARRIAQNDQMKQINIGIIKENNRLKEWYQRNGYQIVCSENFSHLLFEVLYLQLDIIEEIDNGQAECGQSN